MFQFTHPVWGATQRDKLESARREAVSIHAPRVGCDSLQTLLSSPEPPFQFTHPVRGATAVDAHQGSRPAVSIHAPRAGCDTSLMYLASIRLLFQFTHPVWGATIVSILYNLPSQVSIHAPRVGCDSWRRTARRYISSFNSRTPCGVRLSNTTK